MEQVGCVWMQCVWGGGVCDVRGSPGGTDGSAEPGVHLRRVLQHCQWLKPQKKPTRRAPGSPKLSQGPRDPVIWSHRVTEWRMNLLGLILGEILSWESSFRELEKGIERWRASRKGEMCQLWDFKRLILWIDLNLYLKLLLLDSSVDCHSKREVRILNLSVLLSQVKYCLGGEACGHSGHKNPKLQSIVKNQMFN